SPGVLASLREASFVDLEGSHAKTPRTKKAEGFVALERIQRHGDEAGSAPTSDQYISVARIATPPINQGERSADHRQATRRGFGNRRGARGQSCRRRSGSDLSERRAGDHHQERDRATHA